MAALSIIIPTLNEAETITATLVRLALLRARGAEVIVVDGGSRDETVERARVLADQVITGPRGRGAQMNAGAALASADVLLFLHADTQLPRDADRLIREGLQHSGRAWGRFDVAIHGRSPLLPVIAGFMNLRSRLTGIATGDQGIFVTRAAFMAVEGFPDIPLMEDIVLSQQLKRASPPLCLPDRAITSGRRWDERGALRTIFLMWRLRLAYLLGATPDALARQYGYVPRER